MIEVAGLQYSIMVNFSNAAIASGGETAALVVKLAGCASRKQHQRVS